MRRFRLWLRGVFRGWTKEEAVEWILKPTDVRKALWNHKPELWDGYYRGDPWHGSLEFTLTASKLLEAASEFYPDRKYDHNILELRRGKGGHAALYGMNKNGTIWYVDIGGTGKAKSEHHLMVRLSKNYGLGMHDCQIKLTPHTEI